MLFPEIRKCKSLPKIRTWNLLIRSYTRYPLRHKLIMSSSVINLIFINPSIKMNKSERLREFEPENFWIAVGRVIHTNRDVAYFSD